MILFNFYRSPRVVDLGLVDVSSGLRKGSVLGFYLERKVLVCAVSLAGWFNLSFLWFSGQFDSCKISVKLSPPKPPSGTYSCYG